MKTHTIGNCIAILRKEKGLTQQQLAKHLNVSDKAVSKWESENGTPSIEFLPILAELFNVSVNYLMTGKQSPSSDPFAIIEKIAKDDDVQLYEKLLKDNSKLLETPYKGKTLKDYIYQYEAVSLTK